MAVPRQQSAESLDESSIIRDGSIPSARIGMLDGAGDDIDKPQQRGRGRGGPRRGRGRGVKASNGSTPRKAKAQAKKGTATPSQLFAATPNASPPPKRIGKGGQQAASPSPQAIRSSPHLHPTTYLRNGLGTPGDTSRSATPTPILPTRNRESYTAVPEKRSLIVKLKVPSVFLQNIARTGSTSQGTADGVSRTINGDVNGSFARSETIKSSFQSFSSDLDGGLGFNMAPVGGRDGASRVESEVDGALKDTVQALFDIQAATLGYVDGTDIELVNKIEGLTLTLQNLRGLITEGSLSSGEPHQHVVSESMPLIPPDIVQYVDEGRNPDIYTRDFMEAILRYNQNVNGKKKAFADFTDILAEEIRKGISGVEGEVGRIMGVRRDAVEEQLAMG